MTRMWNGGLSAHGVMGDDWLPDTERFGTKQIAEVVQQSEWTVRAYLRERYPRHEGWWLFSRAEFLEIVEDLQRPDAVRHRGGLRFHRK